MDVLCSRLHDFGDMARCFADDLEQPFEREPEDSIGRKAGKIFSVQHAVDVLDCIENVA